jgi:Protein of unknown function DUF2834
LIIQSLFANQMPTFFAMDLIITALTFLVFSYHVANRTQIRGWWVFLLGPLLVGPSLAFPIHLYAREGR